MIFHERSRRESTSVILGGLEGGGGNCTTGQGVKSHKVTSRYHLAGCQCSKHLVTSFIILRCLARITLQDKPTKVSTYLGSSSPACSYLLPIYSDTCPVSLQVGRFQ